MSWSVSQTLERVWNRLPGYLSPSALERCVRIASRIPDCASSHYLEFRLNTGPQIDVLTCTRQRSIAAELEARLGASLSPTWRDNLAVLREWASGTTALSEAAYVGLEYDGGDSFSEAEPEASLAIGLEQDYLSRHWQVLRERDAKTVALGLAAYGRLIPDAHRSACMAALRRCYEALPPQGAIPYAVVMTAREPITAKPYVILPRHAVFGFLEAVGWPGSRAGLEQLLRTYYAAFDRSIYLDLTITDRVHERLGIATSQFQGEEADFSSLDWWGLPPELAQYKAELRDWVGRDETVLNGQRVWIHRWLDTKAVLSSAGIEYKGYLGFSATRPPLFC